jgi:hypothetical protein
VGEVNKVDFCLDAVEVDDNGLLVRHDLPSYARVCVCGVGGDVLSTCSPDWSNTLPYPTSPPSSGLPEP